MSCQTIRKSVSDFLDQRMAGAERNRVAQHMSGCRECAAYFDQVSQLRQGLRTLPTVPVPRRLRTQLQIVASREHARWNSTKTLPLAVRNLIDHVRLAADNMMRPLALPFAGGLASALLLFSVLVPTLGVRPAVGTDVPSGLYTSATLVEVSPVVMNSDGTVIELFVDAKGQAMDYSVQRGEMSPALQADLNQMMVFSRFTPATWFGQPTNGKVLVSFRRVHYVVRG